MRKCNRCDTEMKEGFAIQASGILFGGIEITRGAGLIAKSIGQPKVAICPECGEVSLYIENMSEISKRKK